MNFFSRLKDRIGIDRKAGTDTGGVSSLSSAYISLNTKLNLKHWKVRNLYQENR